MKTPEEIKAEECAEQRALMIERFTQSVLPGVAARCATQDVPDVAIGIAEATVDELVKRYPWLTQA